MIRNNINTIRAYMKVHIKYIFMISYSNSHFLIISIHVEGLNSLKKCSKNLFFIFEKSYSIPGLELTPMYTLQMFFANARHQNTMQHLKQ